MAKLLLLMVLVLGALCVEGWSHNGKEKLKTERKWKRENNVLGEILQEELEHWRKMEMTEEELLELRDAPAAGDDSDDSDDSDEADESPEGDDEDEGSGTVFEVYYCVGLRIFCIAERRKRDCVMHCLI